MKSMLHIKTSRCGLGLGNTDQFITNCSKGLTWKQMLPRDSGGYEDANPKRRTPPGLQLRLHLSQLYTGVHAVIPSTESTEVFLELWSWYTNAKRKLCQDSGSLL